MYPNFKILSFRYKMIQSVDPLVQILSGRIFSAFMMLPYDYYLLSYVYTSEELWVPLLVSWIVIVYFVLKHAIFLAL